MSRRNKWDVGGDVNEIPLEKGGTGAVVSEEELRKKAREAAARIAASAKGFSPAISESLTINHESNDVRQLLTRRHVLEEIEGETGTTVLVKGRYYPPGVPVDPKLPPLHLQVLPKATIHTDGPSQQHAVASAMVKLRACLPVRKGPELVLPFGNAVPSVKRGGAAGVTVMGCCPHQASASAVLPVTFDIPPGFDLWQHLQGPGGSYIAHVQQETGASLQLRWRHSVTSPPVAELHLSFPHNETARHQAAIDLTRSLLATVQSAAIAAAVPAPWASYAQPAAAAPAARPSGQPLRLVQHPGDFVASWPQQHTGPPYNGVGSTAVAPHPDVPVAASAHLPMFQQQGLHLPTSNAPLQDQDLGSSQHQATKAPLTQTAAMAPLHARRQTAAQPVFAQLGTARQLQVPGLAMMVPGQPGQVEEPLLTTSAPPAAEPAIAQKAASSKPKRKFKEFKEANVKSKRQAPDLPAYYKHLGEDPAPQASAHSPGQTGGLGHDAMTSRAKWPDGSSGLKSALSGPLVAYSDDE